MSDTIGVMFQVAGESILPALWDDRSPFLNLHLISSSTPPLATDTYPYPWTELSNASYQPQSIPADSISVTSDSFGSYGVISATQWPFAHYSGALVTVNGWWIDDRRTNPPTPLWGGTLQPPYTIPHVGGMLTIDSITLTLRDCSTSYPLPNVVWFDPFIDVDGTKLPPHRPIVGGNYVAMQGNFECVDDRLQCTSGIDGDWVFFDPGQVNFTARITMTQPSLPPGDEEYPVFKFRLVDLFNSWDVFLAADATTVELRKIVAGVVTVVQSYSISNDQPRTIAVEINTIGPQIIWTVDDKQRSIVTDSFNQAVTPMGFANGAVGPGSSATWRNLIVTVP